ncbi:hypothetical protein LY78DRAFT_43279 [Colletotrichum sublineola]|nr:hypothetical protein LY78DRAFT_43279 [Colletotrichum sublineola]
MSILFRQLWPLEMVLWVESSEQQPVSNCRNFPRPRVMHMLHKAVLSGPSTRNHYRRPSGSYAERLGPSVTLFKRKTKEHFPLNLRHHATGTRFSRSISVAYNQNCLLQ